MTTTSQKPEAFARGARMLCTALGSTITHLLEDPAVVEVMLNPDGRLWVDRLSEGLADTGERLTDALLDRLTHHVHILEMNGDSYRLATSRRRQKDRTVPS